MVRELVLVALGSNLGDSLAILHSSLADLANFSSGGVVASSIWKTSPVDCPADSADYLNAVVRFYPKPDLSPEELLAGLKTIEAKWGRRQPGVRNAPRELDLDLLMFGDQVRDSTQFSLPHPRAVDRRFVMAPAAEVAPDVCWPGDGRTIAEINAALVSDEVVQRLDNNATPEANRY